MLPVSWLYSLIHKSKLLSNYYFSLLWFTVGIQDLVAGLSTDKNIFSYWNDNSIGGKITLLTLDYKLRKLIL